MDARSAISQWSTMESHKRNVHSILGDESPLEFEAAPRMQEAAQAAAPVCRQACRLSHARHKKQCLDKREPYNTEARGSIIPTEILTSCRTSGEGHHEASCITSSYDADQWL